MLESAVFSSLHKTLCTVALTVLLPNQLGSNKWLQVVHEYNEIALNEFNHTARTQQDRKQLAVFIYCSAGTPPAWYYADLRWRMCCEVKLRIEKKKCNSIPFPT